MARRPRDTVIPSSTSAISTNSVITSAVKNSVIAPAATMAIDMDSSMVMRLAIRFSTASLKIGQPPINSPPAPMTLMPANGSHQRHHTAAAARATTTMRSISGIKVSCTPRQTTDPAVALLSACSARSGA